MYKIIKMSLDLENNLPQDATLELLPNDFPTVEAAIKYVSTTIYDSNSEEWANLYSDEDEVSTEIEFFGDDEVNIINEFEEIPYFIEKYKVIKIF